MVETDVAIIGAGPIGLELAVALKRAGVDYLQFDGRQVGYTISWFPPQTRFFSSSERIAIAGVPLSTLDQGKATREEYLRYLRDVVTLFDLRINTHESVERISRDPQGGFTLHTRAIAGQRAYCARRIVFATGGTARPRRLNVPGEDLPQVTHYMPDPHEYFRKRILIIGGRNSAAEAALRCHHERAHVTISYRCADFDDSHIKYWLLPELRGLIKAGKIQMHFSTRVVEIRPGEVTLAKSIIPASATAPRAGLGQIAETPAASGTIPKSADAMPASAPADNFTAGAVFTLKTDFVLALIGYEADLSLLKGLGLEMSPSGQAPRFDKQTMQSSVENVFLAGTVVGGTQDHYRVFIENCHIHVDRILAAITGAPAPSAAQNAEILANPES